MYHSFSFPASFLFFAKQVQGVIKKKWQRFRLSRSLTNSRSRRRSSRTSSVFLSQSEVLFMVSFRNKVFNKRHQSRDYSHPINNQRCTCLRETNECIDCSKVQQYGWKMRVRAPLSFVPVSSERVWDGFCHSTILWFRLWSTLRGGVGVESQTKGCQTFTMWKTWTQVRREFRQVIESYFVILFSYDNLCHLLSWLFSLTHSHTLPLACTQTRISLLCSTPLIGCFIWQPSTASLGRLSIPHL